MEERLKVLEMLRDGIISVDEASELLKTMDSAKVEVEEDGEIKVVSEKQNLQNQKPKMLKIKVDSVMGDRVNVNIPISFLKAAVASGTINNVYNKSFKINGVDQDLLRESIDIDLLIECIENDFVGNLVDVRSAQGDVVNIYFE